MYVIYFFDAVSISAGFTKDRIMSALEKGDGEHYGF
jgi:hypothetical protein